MRQRGMQEVNIAHNSKGGKAVAVHKNSHERQTSVGRIENATVRSSTVCCGNSAYNIYLTNSSTFHFPFH